MPESFQFEITWDTSVVTYVRTSNLSAALAGNNDFQIELSQTVRGSLKVTYVQFSQPMPNLPSPSNLFSLELRLKRAGTTTVRVVDTPAFPATFAGNGISVERPIIIGGDWLINSNATTGGGGGGNPGGSVSPCAGSSGPTIVLETRQA